MIRTIRVIRGLSPHQRAVIVFCFISSFTFAGPFYLKEDGGGKKLQGPYEIKNGGKMVIGDKTYTVIEAPKAEPSLQQKLTKTIIPKIDFRQAHVNDVIEYLKRASTTHSPYKDARHKGVNIVVFAKPEELKRVPLISFSAHDLSLLDALKSICSAAGLRYEIRRKWIMIKVKPRPGK